MDCLQVHGVLSAFLDDRLSASEWRAVEEHIQQCAECGAEHASLVAVRSALRAAPVRPVSRQLELALRILASREAARRRRRLDFGTRVRDFGERLRFRLEPQMKPFALPAAGGLVTAMLLFFSFMTSFQGIVAGPRPNDVPTVLATGPLLKSTLLDTVPDAISVYVLVDDQGRVIDYLPPQELSAEAKKELRRLIGSSLLFTQFDPATTFGRPTAGWVRVTYRSTQLDVRG
jgi:hypothetical protein